MLLPLVDMRCEEIKSFEIELKVIEKLIKSKVSLKKKEVLINYFIFI